MNTSLRRHSVKLFVQQKKDQATNIHSRLILFFALVITINVQNLTLPNCKSGSLSTFTICDQTLLTRERAADLISRMTTAEKITQLVHKVPPYIQFQTARHSSIPSIVSSSARYHLVKVRNLE